MGRRILAFGGSSSRHSINEKLEVFASGLFANKEMFLLATSSGARGGDTVLETVGITNQELKKNLLDTINKIEF